MAWVSTTEIIADRTATVDEQGHRSYVRSWLVQFSELADGPAQAYSATGIPAYLSSYVSGNDSDSLALCKSVDVSLVEPTVYKVTCQYDTKTQDDDPAENAADNPMQISWSFAKFEKIAEKDVVTNLPIQNKADDAFDPAPTIDDSRPVLNIVRNEKTFSITLADTYRDKVNSATWNGFPAKTVKLGSISANRKEIIRDNTKSYYWEVSYQFEFNRDTWKRKILNEGFRRKFVDGATTKKEHIKDDGGQYVATPYLLGNTGDKLAIDGTPVWLEFDVYKTADFSAFNITL